MAGSVHFSVLTKEQFYSVLKLPISGLNRIYLECEVALSLLDEIKNRSELSIYLCSPYIFRKKDEPNFQKLLDAGCFKGVLIRNLEAFSFMNIHYDKYKTLELVLDSNMYVLNSNSLRFYIKGCNYKLQEFYSSFELNEKENKRLYSSIKDASEEQVLYSSLIYGRIPMMISANCVCKTLKNTCEKSSGFEHIKDRKNVLFPVFHNCYYCYNVIYNSVVLSLHNFYGELIGKGNVRLDFTTESGDEVRLIGEYFLNYHLRKPELPYKEYTTGHYKRGVE